MSLTITISLCCSSKPTVSRAIGSSPMPENNSSYILAIRRGVPRSPSRSGSSPIARRIVSTACWMASLSTPRRATLPAAAPSPRALPFPTCLHLRRRPPPGLGLGDPVPGGENGVRHARQPGHESNVVGSHELRALREPVRHRGRRPFQQFLERQPEQVSNVVLAGRGQVDRIPQAPKFPQPAEHFHIVIDGLPAAEPGIHHQTRARHPCRLCLSGLILQESGDFVDHGPVPRIHL